MTSQKLTDLTETTAPVDTDYAYVVVDPTGSPASRYVKLNNLLRLAHGSLTLTAGSGTQALSATTWTKVTQFDAAVSGISVTADHSNDRITIPTTGWYLICWQATFTGAANGAYDLAVYWNSTGQSIASTKLDASGSKTSVTVFALVSVTSADAYAEAYVQTDGANNFDLKESRFSVIRLA